MCCFVLLAQIQQRKSATVADADHHHHHHHHLCKHYQFFGSSQYKEQRFEIISGQQSAIEPKFQNI